MANPRQCLASLSRLSLSTASRPSVAAVPPLLAPSLFLQTRCATNRASKAAQEKKKKDQAKAKAKARKVFKSYNPALLDKYSLCDAIRYCRAFEVGRPPPSAIYSLSVKLRTAKNGPVVRGKVRLPHAIEPPTTSSSDATTGADSATPKIAVICAPDSDAARTALSLGAVAVGEDEIFTSVKDGTYTFTHLLCHEDSAPALARQQSVLGPVLGRKGLMPTARRGTVTSDIATAMREIISGAAAARAAGGEVREYRERLGVVRMKVGGIWFTPRMLADNVAAFMKQVKEDVERIDEEDGHSKALDEVVLASTNSPGFSLNGAFGPTEREPGLKAEMLEGPM